MSDAAQHSPAAPDAPAFNADVLQAATDAVAIAREHGMRIGDMDALLLARSLASVIEGAELLGDIVTRAASDWRRGDWERRT
jgi:hypothetical protein